MAGTAAIEKQEAAARPARSKNLVGLFSATLCVAALLLFSLQPMFAKRVLPILGGTPAVWSVATVVFQALLLAGYAWAYALVRWLSPERGIVLHGLVLAGGFVALPVGIAAGLGAPPPDAEAGWLIALFLASIGLPFFALSASAPLLQAWFARSGDPRAGDPYFLYRASNAGSFAALLAYPLLVEPLMGLDAQGRLWTLGYTGLACLVLACAYRIQGAGSASAPRAEATRSAGASRPLAWIALSAVPSGLLVAATAHISTDVAAIPLLWVVPLALYLLSFIFAFRPGTAWPTRTLALLQVIGTAIALVASLREARPLALDLTVTLGLLFVNALIAHRAVYALRPPAERLTGFYLCTSLGGVLGGSFAALLAPLVFDGVYEYPLLLVASLACTAGIVGPGALAQARHGLLVAIVIAAAAGLVALTQEGRLWVDALIWPLALLLLASWHAPARAACAGALLGLACTLVPLAASRDGESHRSFFGTHRIRTSADGQFRTLSHGTTLHGAMRIRDADGTAVTGRPEPTTYYAAGGPIADVLEASRRANGPIPAVSVVGLGTGSLACHARGGEAWTYFEIDPAVIRIATDPVQFRFLSDCAPGAAIVQGDARLTLAERPGAARVLIVDAFSSDAIPMHLLTREALGIDLAHLDAQGLVAFHITNRHFELKHVLARLAAEHGLTLLHRGEAAGTAFVQPMRQRAYVAMLTRDPAVIREAQALGWSPIAPDLTRRPWTDDHADAIEAMLDRAREP